MNSQGTILLVGATSALGRAFAGALAKKGYALVLAGRSEDEISRVAADIRLRFGVQTAVEVYDARESDARDTGLLWTRRILRSATRSV